MDTSSSLSIEAYCAHHFHQHLNLNKEQSHDLPLTSAAFLKTLNLPFIHPFCEYSKQTLIQPMSPPMGPPPEFCEPIGEAIITTILTCIPPFLALTYMLCALVAVYLAPLGILFLLHRSQASRYIGVYNKKKPKIKLWRMEFEGIFHMTLLFSWLVITDDLYVLGVGRVPGLCMLLALFFIAAVIHTKNMLGPSFWHRAVVLLGVCSIVSPWRLTDPDQAATTVKPGTYYNHENPNIKAVVERWKTNLPEYEQIQTPWQFTGDARTGLPFLMNNPPAPIYHRVWMPTVDDEFIALDIAFPNDGHNASYPLYLVLHGLNGGSTEGYVMDLVQSRTKAGSTVVVMVARGLMDTPIQGWTMFNGIRVDDVEAAATLLRERALAPNQTLAGVGYSMGAIVLNRYLVTSKKVALDVSVSISGALNTLYQKDYCRSKRTWQSLITSHMKDMFFRGKWGRRLYYRLGHEGYRMLLRSQNIVESDFFTGVICDGYYNLNHFYTEMSSVLGYPFCEGGAAECHDLFRLKVPIPHVVLQAMDDPISTWRSNAANDPDSSLYPKKLVAKENQDNIVLLLTSNGGHVGWPIGWWPHSWQYMNEFVASGFVDAYHEQESTASIADENPGNTFKRECK